MMLDTLREGAQGKVAKVILILIILSFALAGIGSYINGPARTAPASVNGEEISASALENAYRNERSRLESQMGEAFNQLAANPEYSKKLRRDVLDRLIEQALLDSKAKQLGLRVGDEAIKAAIMSMPDFAVDGKFSNERYLQLVRNAGMTPEAFGESLRQEMVRQQLVGALLGSEVALKPAAEQLDKLYNQTRDLQVVRINVADHVAAVSVSEEEIAQFYKANGNRFMSDEQVKIDYLLLDAAALSQGIKVTADDAKRYYDEHQELFARAERRQVAHILLPFNDDEAAAEKAATDLLAKLQQGGDFAASAKAQSGDTFSASKGGALDWFERGVMDAAFEEAAFALANVGDLSGVVKSPFGFHLIKLLAVEAGQTKPFAEVEAETISRLQAEKAKERYFSEQQKLADASFENPDSLDMAAQALGLKVQSSDYFSRENAPAPFNDAKVLAQAFAENLRDENTNSEVIEIGDGKALVLHITGHRPRATKPLAEVKTELTAAITQEKAGELARALGQSVVDAVQSGTLIADAVRAAKLSVETLNKVARFGDELDQAVLAQAFSLPRPVASNGAVKPSLTLASQANGDRVVLALTAVNEPSEASQLAGMLQGQLAQSQSQAQYQALLKLLRKNASIEYFAQTDLPQE
ncbi:MAG: peptidylprolyl isomerase [Aeromonas sp.]